MELVPLAIAVYNARGTPEYESLLNQLPEAYQDCYHKLIQYGAQYVITFWFAQRGEESILKMDIYDLVFEEDETLQFGYWREVITHFEAEKFWIFVLVMNGRLMIGNVFIVATQA